MLRELEGFYEAREAAGLVNWLLSHYLGTEGSRLALMEDRIAGGELTGKLVTGLQELKAFRPVQYITGEAYFHGLKFKTNPHVLIPRPETEELVQWVVEDHASVPGLDVLDLGTGSGCIIVTLGKKLRDPLLTGIDISPAALSVARGNARDHKVKVDFYVADMLSPGFGNEKRSYDLIVSNPPYVRRSEERFMRPNVLNYEPHSALFVSDLDPLVFYRAITAFAHAHLAVNGHLYLEINEAFGDEVIALLKIAGFRDIILRKDMKGKDRLISAGF